MVHARVLVAVLTGTVALASLVVGPGPTTAAAAAGDRATAAAVPAAAPFQIVCPPIPSWTATGSRYQPGAGSGFTSTWICDYVDVGGVARTVEVSWYPGRPDSGDYRDCGFRDSTVGDSLIVASATRFVSAIVTFDPQAASPTIGYLDSASWKMIRQAEPYAVSCKGELPGTRPTPPFYWRASMTVGKPTARVGTRVEVTVVFLPAAKAAGRTVQLQVKWPGMAWKTMQSVRLLRNGVWGGYVTSSRKGVLSMRSIMVASGGMPAGATSVVTITWR